MGCGNTHPRPDRRTGSAEAAWQTHPDRAAGSGGRENWRGIPPDRIRPHLGQRVQFLGVQALVIAILTVAVLQPLHTAKELLIPGSFLLGAGRLQIDDRVLLGELLNISLQFHCAHLKEREALERLLGELLSLPLDQFHKGRLLFQSYYSKYAKGKQDRHKA